VAVHLVMLLHSVVSAGTYLAAKRALGELSPWELALARFVLAALCYAALLAPRRVRIPRRDLLGLAALGVVAIPINQGFFLAGLARTTPAHAALLYALTPIFVFLLARWKLAEPTTAAKLVGIALAFAGVVVVLASRPAGGLGSGGATLAGDLLVLLAVAAWAVFAVAGKRYAEQYGALASTGVAVIFGTIAYLPFGLALSSAASFSRLSAVGWGSLAYLVLITSVLSYLLYYWALRRAEASRVAVWSNLQPVLTAPLAWALLGDPMGVGLLAGGAMVLSGVLLTQRGEALAGAVVAGWKRRYLPTR
jgi:drug/metabolite transporter (DMT)-like permease